MFSDSSLLIGLVSISDRASAGVYEDKGVPGLVEWFTAALSSPWRMETRLIPDEQPVIERTLIELVDTVGCHLVLTTGGTGPAPRDVTPEATPAVAHKVLPGFGEQMRAVSLKYGPTAILSRRAGVVRGSALILNLPGQPKAIKETLDGLPAVPCASISSAGPTSNTRGGLQGIPAQSAARAAGVIGAGERRHATLASPASSALRWPRRDGDPCALRLRGGC
jgi:molybdopterin adenylyltransferase